jgi:pimeloyl-ACP methyl ester carboxylesterase
MWLPESTPFKSVRLAPAGQLLIAVEDRFFNIRNGVVDAESIAAPGYAASFDPFFDHQVGLVLTSPPDKLPASDEVVVPYPLNRLNRTLDWLYAHKKVDSNRVALVGHSGGAKGSLMWSHASPERFAYAGRASSFPCPNSFASQARNCRLPLMLRRSGAKGDCALPSGRNATAMAATPGPTTVTTLDPMRAPGSGGFYCGIEGREPMLAAQAGGGDSGPGFLR